MNLILGLFIIALSLTMTSIHLHFVQSIRKTKVFLKYWHTEKLAEQLEKAQGAVITIQKGKRS